jgi:hypothetical protein
VKSIPKLVIQDNDVMFNVLSTMFHGFAHTWYHNLEPGLIINFHYLNAKIILHFSTRIPAKKKSTTRLVAIT